MLPTQIYHADWGTDPSKRWLARATLELDGRFTAEAARPVGDHMHLITSIRSEIGSQGCALVGFDFPIGVPERYASAAGIKDFKSLLLELGTGNMGECFPPGPLVCGHARSVIYAKITMNARCTIARQYV